MPEPKDVFASGQERRLESWGEIASYLRREIRTVQRWEKALGLPIRRLQGVRQSSVYAYPSELDKWYREREPREVKEDDSPQDLAAEPNRDSGAVAAKFNRTGFESARQRYGWTERGGRLIAEKDEYNDAAMSVRLR